MQIRRKGGDIFWIGMVVMLGCFIKFGISGKWMGNFGGIGCYCRNRGQREAPFISVVVLQEWLADPPKMGQGLTMTFSLIGRAITL